MEQRSQSNKIERKRACAFGGAWGANLAEGIGGRRRFVWRAKREEFSQR